MLALTYFICLLLGSAVAMPLGGVLHALLGLSFAIPYFGPAFAFLINRLIKITFLTKVAAWAISASGLIATYLLIAKLLGPPRGLYQWGAVAAAAAIVALDISYRIMMFRPYHVTTVEDIKEMMPKFIAARMDTLDTDERNSLIRQNFADVNFTAILQLLVAFGMLLFALSNMHYLPTKNGDLPSLLECLAVAFSFVSLAGGDTVAFVGPLWLALRFIGGVVLLVWAVAFVGFALKFLPKPVLTDPEFDADILADYRENLERIVAEVVDPPGTTTPSDQLQNSSRIENVSEPPCSDSRDGSSDDKQG